jgi:class 3 adenylate cyclase
MLKNLSFFLILLLCSSFTVNSQSARISAQKSVILNDTLSPDEAISLLYSYEKWGAEPITIKELVQIKKIITDRKRKSQTLRDQYFICLVDCKRFVQSKQIGKALYCANSFYKKVRALKNDEQLINVYQLFATIYEDANMIDDALKYTRLLYALKCKNKSEAEIIEFSHIFIWKFFAFGRYKNSAAILNESQKMGEDRIRYFQKHPPPNFNYIADDYKVNIMALLRLKKWSKAIDVSRKAFNYYGLDVTKTDDGYFNYARKLLTYIAVSHAHLKNKDSALFYMYNPIMLQKFPTDRNIYLSEKKAYLDADEVMELINILSLLKEDKKAADLAYKAVYSQYKFKNKDFRDYVLSTYARVFQKAGMYKEAAEGYKFLANMTDSTNQEEINTLIEKQTVHNRIEISNVNEINAKKDEIAKKKLEQQILVRNAFIFGFSLFLIFSIAIFFQRNKIKKGKKLSDELLLNILPYSIAEELKLNGKAESKLINEVTVLFTDFKGFTQLSEQFTAQELVAEINECFSAFDRIMEKNHVEKIKTIGDAYMAAGGLPSSNQTHASDVVNAALEIQQYMINYKENREKAGKLFFEIRIGVHSGPVVAGIVGIKKFAYDIWGDTVNTASRMESSGEVGKVNVSESTYKLTQEKFKFEYRGKITAKGKGEINMYFVERKIPSFKEEQIQC